MKKEWWKTLFDDKYTQTYVDTSSEKRTATEVDFLLKNLSIKKGTNILDLACGYGRHAIKLSQAKFKVTGLDYSKHLINLAKATAKEKGLSIDFLRGDIRNFSFSKKFDAVICMFTSFGYFTREEDHEKVIKQVSKALKRNGVFFLDVKNPIATTIDFEKNISAGNKELRKTETLSNGINLSTSQVFDIHKMRWKINRTWKINGKVKKYYADIRLFTLPELSNLLGHHNLRIEKVWGNFNGSPLSYNSPRIIVLARKK